jgi:hypothetical protein
MKGLRISKTAALSTACILWAGVLVAPAFAITPTPTKKLPTPSKTARKPQATAKARCEKATERVQDVKKQVEDHHKDQITRFNGLIKKIKDVLSQASTLKLDAAKVALVQKDLDTLSKDLATLEGQKSMALDALLKSQSLQCSDTPVTPENRAKFQEQFKESQKKYVEYRQQLSVTIKTDLAKLKQDFKVLVAPLRGTTDDAKETKPSPSPKVKATEKPTPTPTPTPKA